MGSTQAYHDPEFLREVWALFGVGVTILIARFLVRLRTVGFRNFQGDDYFSILVLLCYTADAATVTITYLYGSNVDYSPQELAAFDQDELDKIIFGSKMQLFAWYTYTALVWGLKACMLFFFNRLTFGLDTQTYVKLLAVACGMTYLAVFLTISAACHPIERNWQVLPYPPPQCTLKAQNMYVCTILNVLTDAAMLAIPMPLLWKLRVPLRRKLTLAALLSSGIFVITAAIVRITMTLKAHPSALTINRWGVRETIAGILAVNIPILAPLFAKAFWKGDFPTPDGARHGRGASSGEKSSRSSKLANAFRKADAYEMSSRSYESAHTKSKATSTTAVIRACGQDPDSDRDEDTASEDLIIQKYGTPEIDSDVDAERGKQGVMVRTTYDVRPASGTAAELPAEPAASHQSSSSSWHQGRFWDSSWQDKGYGNSVTVGASSDAHSPR